MRRIYHFTHLRNLATILADGGLWSDSECARRHPESVRSGNAEIKARRLSTRVPAGLGRGGCVGDYVPFYFAPRSPMLYSISRGNVDGVSSNQDAILYFVADALDFAPPDFVGTDGNAAHGLSDFFGSHAEVERAVDWPLMKERYWNDTPDDGDRKRRRQAEFLVHRFVEWATVLEVVTRTAETRDLVLLALRQSKQTHLPPVTIQPDWYF